MTMDSDAVKVEDILSELERFYADLDQSTGRLFSVHRERIRCARGCCDCCIDNLAVYEVEADRIRAAAADLLDNGMPHPPGRCAFLSDEGACRIHPVRPFVCRTQGLPFRWIGESSDGRLGEQREICDLNENDQAIEELSARDCWTIGPFEERLAEIQRAMDGGKGKRVRLRDLFRRDPGRA